MAIAELADALQADGALDTPLRRQLLGFEMADGTAMRRRGFR